jgi:DNA modification methylase
MAKKKTTTTKPTKGTKATKKTPKPAEVACIAPDLRALAVRIEGLVFDPHNARGHNSDNLSAIRASLEKFGQRKPIVVNRRNQQVEAGNGLVEAAVALGWSHVAVVWVDDDPAAQRGFSLADNRTAELASWKDDVLEALCREWQTDGEQLDLYDALKLDALLGVPEAEPEIVEDEAPEPPADPITKPGDLWLLGEHRVLCRDCRDVETWNRLLDGERVNVCMTSPPYASQRKYDETSGFKPIKPDEYVAWWEPLQAAVKANLAANGSFFVNIRAGTDDGELLLYVFDLVLAMARQWGWRLVDELCWLRPAMPGKFSCRFKNGWEPVFHFGGNGVKFLPDQVLHKTDRAFCYKDQVAAGKTMRVSGLDGSGQGKGGGANHPANEHEGLALPSNVLDIKAPAEAIGHSAAFPVGLPSFFIRAFSDEGDNVADPFLGSGTTLIAAEQLHRRCFGIEISPAYCDVIVARWEKLTGGKARREKAGASLRNRKRAG